MAFGRNIRNGDRIEFRGDGYYKIDDIDVFRKVDEADVRKAESRATQLSFYIHEGWDHINREMIDSLNLVNISQN